MPVAIEGLFADILGLKSRKDERPLFWSTISAGGPALPIRPTITPALKNHVAELGYCKPKEDFQHKAPSRLETFKG